MEGVGLFCLEASLLLLVSPKSPFNTQVKLKMNIYGCVNSPKLTNSSFPNSASIEG